MAGRVTKKLAEAYEMTQLFYVKECPECFGDTEVVDSRLATNGSIRRRRICTVCGFKYNTFEVDEVTCDVSNIADENARLKAENAALQAKIEQINKILGE